MDGRNWIIIQYYCQLLRWLRFGLRLCWSESVSQSCWGSKAGSNHSSQFRNSQILFPFPLSTLNSHTNKIASNSSSGLPTLAIDS